MDTRDEAFDEGIVWDPALRAVRIYATFGKNRVCFAFDASAVNDYFQTKDDDDFAKQNIEEHRAAFENLSRRLINDGVPPYSEGLYFVGTLLLERYRP